MEHETRAHALLSASGAHRWLACTPSAVLEQQFPDTTSVSAQEGTLAHELAEMKLRNCFYTQDFNKRKLTAGINRLKKEELWQDEMLHYTEEYLDYIKTAAFSRNRLPTVEIEKKLDLRAYVPGGFGTADCVLIGGGILHIIDLKYGKSPEGRVDAERNPQLSLYALGAYETYKLLYPVQEIRLSIVQPRLPDGISEWSCTLEDLLAFGEYVKERAALAIKGEGTFAPGPETCKYCRAKSRCKARAERNLTLAPLTKKPPVLLTNEEIGQYLLQGRDVEKWLNDLKDYALSECLAGHEVPGWKAVEGWSQRVWKKEDEALQILVEKGIAAEILWEKKPLSLAKIEQAVGKKIFQEMVGDQVVKSPGNPTLVEETDQREAISNRVSAKTAFSIMEEKET